MASIGQKADYVRDKIKTASGGHRCHWPGCERRVPPAMWGCREHWYRLPRLLRTLIWRTYRPGQEADKRPSAAYVEAARRAQQWIKENAG